MSPIRHTIKDAEREVTFVVLAFRQLERTEVVHCVQLFRAQNPKIKFKRGQTVEIATTIS